MKSTLLIMVLSFASWTNLSAQENDLVLNRNPYKHALKLSAGPSHITSAPGVTVQTEYAVSLGRFFEILADVSMVNANDGIKNETRTYDVFQPVNSYIKSVQYSMVAVGASICITPIKTYRHRLLAGAGVNFCHLTETNSVMNGLSSPTTFSQTNDRNTGGAFSAVIGYEYNASERLLMGFKGHGIFFKENSTAILATLGYRFD